MTPQICTVSNFIFSLHSTGRHIVKLWSNAKFGAYLSRMSGDGCGFLFPIGMCMAEIYPEYLPPTTTTPTTTVQPTTTTTEPTTTTKEETTVTTTMQPTTTTVEPTTTTVEPTTTTVEPTTTTVEPTTTTRETTTTPEDGEKFPLYFALKYNF